MVFPLHDDNPTRGRPHVTVAIIVVCIAVFAAQHLLLTETSAAAAIYAFGVVPAELTGRVAPQFDILPPAATALTSMFMHGGLLHLFGNLWYLWIFGNNVEDAMGHGRFVVFYLLCGLVAVAAQVLPAPGSTVPMVGASGAISGVLGAYMLLYPRARVLLGMPLGFVVVQLGRFPAVWVLAGWFVMQLAMGGMSLVRPANAGGGGIAFGAHIGGFVAGCALIPLFKRRDVPLWRRH